MALQRYFTFPNASSSALFVKPLCCCFYVLHFLIFLPCHSLFFVYIHLYSSLFLALCQDQHPPPRLPLKGPPHKRNKKWSASQLPVFFMLNFCIVIIHQCKIKILVNDKLCHRIVCVEKHIVNYFLDVSFKKQQNTQISLLKFKMMQYRILDYSKKLSFALCAFKHSVICTYLVTNAKVPPPQKKHEPEMWCRQNIW